MNIPDCPSGKNPGFSGKRSDTPRRKDTHVGDGFDFPEQNVRKYDGKVIIKPETGGEEYQSSPDENQAGCRKQQSHLSVRRTVGLFTRRHSVFAPIFFITS